MAAAAGTAPAHGDRLHVGAHGRGRAAGAAVHGLGRPAPDRAALAALAPPAVHKDDANAAVEAEALVPGAPVRAVDGSAALPPIRPPAGLSPAPAGLLQGDRAG